MMSKTGWPTERGRRWASTMSGHAFGDLRAAHRDSWAGPGITYLPPKSRTTRSPRRREEPDRREQSAGLERSGREEIENAVLAPGATLSQGAGNRQVEEEPDPWRTCFERDRDRILHSASFRRLAGKTQVFIFPADHQRTRLTHALEVAQVATRIAEACRLNVHLTEAIALGHDCGHGPGGHASEDALEVFLPEGFDHAVWGADVALAALNLCDETLDGIRNHSWSRPAPRTAEGEVVSWADRIAYVCHDWEDAVNAGIVSAKTLPPLIRARCGETRSAQLRSFIEAVVNATIATGQVGMSEDRAEALAAFRQCNYEHIYLRPASIAQGKAVVDVLRALVEHLADHPGRIPLLSSPRGGPSRKEIPPSGSEEAVRAAVGYVAGMTDRFAMNMAVSELDWDPRRIPRGIEDWRVR